MKIRLTESQLKKVISEITNSDNNLLNSLIDKIAESGFDSLSDREKLLLRKLTGEKVVVPPEEPVKQPTVPTEDLPNEEESADIQYASLMFFEKFPQDAKFRVDDKVFRTVINDFEEGDVETEYEPEENKYIIITDEIITLKMFPFHNNTRNFVVVTNSGLNLKNRYNGDIPNDDKKIDVFIKYVTMSIIPKYIKEAIKHHDSNKDELR